MAGPALRILGIDPGLRITGFGIIEKNGASIAYIASGCIKSGGADLPGRLKTILENLREVIGEHRPQQIAIEKVFVNVNPASTLALGQARGTAICAAVDAGLPMSEYTALQVKQAVVGLGHARKEQVQEMVKRLLRLPGHPSADAADALACAICHAHGGMGLGAIPTRGRRVRAGRIST
jgi:crossover junction endodeoxyribonuclease RuvC